VNAFQRACSAEHALRRAIEHLYALEYRANRRFQLWFRDDDDPLVVKLIARIAPRHDMRLEHEQAEWRRDKLWDEWSRHMPPSAEMVDEQAAAGRAIGRNGRLALFVFEPRLALLRCHDIDISSEERQALVDGIAGGLVANEVEALALVDSMRTRQ
jgi:hypothetical protein